MPSIWRGFWAKANIGLAIVLLGCTSQKPATPSAVPAQPSEEKPQGSSTNGDLDIPAFPPGAQSTFLCNTFSGPAHVVEATQAKEYLKQRSGLDQWYIIHSDDQSDLYFGFYSTDDDHANSPEGHRAAADRDVLTRMQDEDGRKMFAQVLFVPISLPDPEAPREWEVSNNTGFWTLQIAVYKDSPERKQAAVDTVRDLRAHGVQAWYHHGETMSFVYIGSWPRDAVKQQDADSAQARDPNTPLVVMSGPIAGAENAQFQTADGRKAKVVMPKLQIVDPDLKIMAEQYPYTYVNGEGMGRKVTSVDGTTTVIPYPSYLVQLQPDTQPRNQNPSDQGEAPPPTSEVPGLGGLR